MVDRPWRVLDGGVGSLADGSDVDGLAPGRWRLDPVGSVGRPPDRCGKVATVAWGRGTAWLGEVLVEGGEWIRGEAGPWRCRGRARRRRQGNFVAAAAGEEPGGGAMALVSDWVPVVAGAAGEGCGGGGAVGGWSWQRATGEGRWWSARRWVARWGTAGVGGR